MSVIPGAKFKAEDLVHGLTKFVPLRAGPLPSPLPPSLSSLPITEESEKPVFLPNLDSKQTHSTLSDTLNHSTKKIQAKGHSSLVFPFLT